MRTFIFIPVAAALCLAAPARAEGPFPWRGAFMEGDVSAHRYAYGRFGAAFEAGYEGFPGDDYPHRMDVLGGIRWTKSQNWMMELKFGYERLWLREDKEDRFVVGIRKRWDFPSLRLRLRLEQDHSFLRQHGKLDYDYHGDYSIAYRLVDLPTLDDQAMVSDLKPAVRGQTVGVKGRMNPLEVHVGLRTDHHWTDTDFGPFLAFTRPHVIWQFEVQHFSNFWGARRGHSAHFVLRFHL